LFDVSVEEVADQGHIDIGHFALENEADEITGAP
jgi:hypothetical protein